MKREPITEWTNEPNDMNSFQTELNTETTKKKII